MSAWKHRGGNWIYKRNTTIFYAIEIYHGTKIISVPAHFYPYEYPSFTVWYQTLEEAIKDIDGALGE